MMHLGDITKISGFDAPPVDVVIGGSPCQDLSVAGKRAGLAGVPSSRTSRVLRYTLSARFQRSVTESPATTATP